MIKARIGDLIGQFKANDFSEFKAIQNIVFLKSFAGLKTCIFRRSKRKNLFFNDGYLLNRSKLLRSAILRVVELQVANGMRVWLISFVLLFGAAELYQWASELTLPMPIFILGGAFLAIASNYDKLRNLPIHIDYEAPESKPKTVTPATTNPVIVKPTAQTRQPISFEIRRPFKPGD